MSDFIFYTVNVPILLAFREHGNGRASINRMGRRIWSRTVTLLRVSDILMELAYVLSFNF